MKAFVKDMNEFVSQSVSCQPNFTSTIKSLYLSEIIILKNPNLNQNLNYRAATVIATSDEVVCMTLNREQFELMLGPLKETLDFNLGFEFIVLLCGDKIDSKLSEDRREIEKEIKKKDNFCE